MFHSKWTWDVQVGPVEGHQDKAVYGKWTRRPACPELTLMKGVVKEAHSPE